MDYMESINYRNFIEKKVFESQKLTEDEKRWLMSNPIFNNQFNFPCYQKDVIDVPENSKITISVLNYGDKTKIYRPVIAVIGKGAIKVNKYLLDIDKNNVDYKETRILIPLLDENCRETTVGVISKSGLLNIQYQCEYYDERMKLYKIEMSGGANLSYAMKKENSSNNEYIYYCKSPALPNNSPSLFNEFIFSVKIEKQT